MRAPDCPTHGRLVLDLALGRLDDGPAAEAERVLRDCPACAAWWHATFEGADAERLDEVLTATFAAFEPSSRRVARWLPVAAAAALAVTAGVVYEVVQHQTERVQPSQSAVVLETFDGDRDGNGRVDMNDLGFAAHVDGIGETIFAGNQDDGDLDGWNSHT